MSTYYERKNNTEYQIGDVAYTDLYDLVILMDKIVGESNTIYWIVKSDLTSELHLIEETNLLEVGYYGD